MELDAQSRGTHNLPITLFDTADLRQHITGLLRTIHHTDGKSVGYTCNLQAEYHNVYIRMQCYVKVAYTCGLKR